MGSSIAQYSIVLSIWFYFLPYTWEFKNSHAIFTDSAPWLTVEEAEEASFESSADSKRGV